MSCVAFVLLKMMLLSHFWVIEENRKVFALLMSGWILCSPFSHRCFSQTCTEHGYTAWLAILLFKMTILYFSFECVKVNKTSAGSIYGRAFGIGFFLGQRKLTGLSEGRLWVPVLCVFSSPCSSCSLSFSLTLQSTWLMSRCFSVISTSGGLPISGRIRYCTNAF